MSRLLDRIPKEQFHEVFRPVIRFVGSRDLILRLNQTAKTAIPRQTKLDPLMEKLAVLCYEQNRPKVEEELEQLFSLYVENRLRDADEDFSKLSDELNKNLDGEHLPKEPEKLSAVRKTLEAINQLLVKNDFSQLEVDTVFRIKAFPEVLNYYLAEKDGFQTESEPEVNETKP